MATEAAQTAKATGRETGAWLVVALLAVAMCALTIVTAKRQTLGVDEVFSLAMATGHSLEHPASAANPALGDYVESPAPQSARDLSRYTAPDDAGLSRVLRAVSLSDTSPPLYYLLLNGWIRLAGTSDLSLRLMSILCAAASLPLIFIAGRLCAGSRAGVSAALLFAISPVGLHYATEGRMYALVWLLLLGCALLTWRLARGLGGWASQLGWVAIGAAGLLTHYFFIFPWAAMAAYRLLAQEKRRRETLASIVIVFLLVLPWYQGIPHNLAAWRVTGDWLSIAPQGFERPRAFRDLALQFLTAYPGEGHRRANVLALLAFAVALTVAFARSLPNGLKGPTVLVWSWLAAALIGPLAFDVLFDSYTVAVPRYAISALPAVCLLAGFGLAALDGRLAAGLAACLTLLLVPGQAQFYRQSERGGLAVAQPAALINQAATPNDLIVIHSIPSGALTMARYLTTGAPVMTWVGQLGVRAAPQDIAAQVKGRRRVWFVALHTVGAPAPEEDWLRANGATLREESWGRTRLIEFAPADK